MKKNRAWIFWVLAVVLAVSAVMICLTQRNGEPRLLGTASGARDCAEGLMSRIGQGDFAGASAYLYGSPSLAGDYALETPAGTILWGAFLDSLECSLQGDCYATDSGLAQDCIVTGLDLPELTRLLKERSAAVLEARLADAQDMTQVYEGDQYREDFAQAVLEQAAKEAVQAAPPVSRQVTLQLVYDRNQWWVMPDESLLSAISGGIL